MKAERERRRSLPKAPRVTGGGAKTATQVVLLMRSPPPIPHAAAGGSELGKPGLLPQADHTEADIQSTTPALSRQTAPAPSRVLTLEAGGALTNTRPDSLLFWKLQRGGEAGGEIHAAHTSLKGRTRSWVWKVNRPRNRPGRRVSSPQFPMQRACVETPEGAFLPSSRMRLITAGVGAVLGDDRSSVWLRTVPAALCACQGYLRLRKKLQTYVALMRSMPQSILFLP